MKKLQKSIVKLLCVLSVMLSLFKLPVQAASYEYVSIKGTYYQQEAKEHLRLLNQVRKKGGVSTLKMDKDLMAAAELRAAEVSIYWGTTHYRPNGLYSRSVHSKAWGENFCDADDASSSVSMFVGSEAHYNHMMTAGYSSVGIACFEAENGKRIWVQMFGGNQINEQKTYKKEVKKTLHIEVPKNKTTFKIGGETDYRQMNYSDTEIYGGTTVQYYVYGNFSKDGIHQFVSNTSLYKWSSSDEKIATITSDGYLYALRKGTVTITAKGNGKTYTKKIKVLGDNHITYSLNGGKLDPLAPRDVYIYLKLKPATKPNYLFKGWFYDSNFQMKVPKEDYINWDEKVYAKWAKVKVEDSKTPKMKITSSSKRLQVKIPDVSKADGYQVYISTNKNFRNVTKAIVMKTNTYTGSKVVKGKTYYVKTRAFRYDSTKARIYGGFSETVKIKAT